ncbi:MAG TPA: DHHA1 domain-containing protein [Kofleriaceae bacterium]|nr:DHHA1 domain-containing protein [Kofleriaceae bacterium]
MTRRLYHDDAYARTFDAEVIAMTPEGAVLDRTAFYPEAGGQLGDHGTLGGVVVRDTQELDDGTIVHVVADPLPLGPVRGELDWARRRQHMAQHTAQHLLSGALLDRAAAPTASARLGESALTIDVARDRIPEADLAAAETLANDIIDDDLAIRAWFPSADELASLKLRRDPKVAADIRVVAIGDFDLSPCGGTHCARTSQIGAVRITSTERYKGMTRVTFTAARRGRADLFARDHVLRGLATQFSCGPAEVPSAIDKLRRDADAASVEITALRGRLAGIVASSFSGTGAVVAALPGDAELLRGVAAKLVASGRDAILCAPDETGATAVLFRAPGSTLDCGALWKKLAATLGGRGGGKADRAEGRFATPPANWTATIAELLG